MANININHTPIVTAMHAACMLKKHTATMEKCTAIAIAKSLLQEKSAIFAKKAQDARKIKHDKQKKWCALTSCGKGYK